MAFSTKPIAAIATACLMLVTGCSIRGINATFLRYNAADDSFSQLNVFADVATRGKDLDEIESLWKRRESVVIMPFNFLTISTIERREAHSFRWIEIGSSPPDKWRTVPDVDLNSILIQPGEFFENSSGNLCNYHQVTVPGKTLDAILVAMKPWLESKISEGADEALRSGGDTWENYCNGLLNDLDKMAGIQGSRKVSQSGKLPLSRASLKLLKGLNDDLTIGLGRERDRFFVRIPMLPEDCRQCLATLKEFRSRIDELIADKKSVEPGLVEFVESLTMRHMENFGLEVTVDFIRFCRAVNLNAQKQLAKPPGEDQSAESKRMLAVLKNRGVPVLPTFPNKELTGKYVE